MKNLFYILIGLLLLCSGIRAQTSLFVSPEGDDANQGTKADPFASMEKALLEARSMPGNVTICLLGGTYYRSRPVVFTPEDSRPDGEKLIITNFEDQEVTLSGSVVLKLNWKSFKSGIWQAKVSQELLFDELFVNGQLQTMARFPNYDPRERYYGGTADEALIKQRSLLWKSPEGAYIHALHPFEWGDVHYLVKGIDKQGEWILEGGWQNNRPMGMHEKYRFVENVYEELDTVNEWFYDQDTRTLFFFPPEDLDLESALFESPQIAHLIEFKGTETDPVKNISIQGLKLTQTLRTFMLNKEPLLRSDWTIYRGAAVLFEGALNCSLVNCTLSHLGGNAVFFNNFNRKCQVLGSLIHNVGASAVCFVGDPDAVRSPSFQYHEFIPLDQIDRTPGPKTNNYPADCRVYDNLIYKLGLIEKQSAAVELSMCQGIHISHNTIYDVPRAGINVSEGTWGGHVIEFNDVFRTVQESGDHGSFNSWGRDRFWHPDKRILDSIVETQFDLALLDVVKPITIRNNRMRCDHGWDIDLDDGSSNYIIYNNLCLNGGIKLREGVKRVVENNIMINNTFHPHVWFTNSSDIFRHNIVSSGYLPIDIKVWGKETDYNVFPDSISLKEAQNRGTDLHSVCGKLSFTDPLKGDFRLADRSIAFSVGFKNFAMDSFGVVSPWLRSQAEQVALPTFLELQIADKDEIVDFLGARVKNLTTLGERSATGMDDIRGVLVLEVADGSVASEFLQVNDVILSLHQRPINTISELLDESRSLNGAATEISLFRNQREIKKWIKLGVKTEL